MDKRTYISKEEALKLVAVLPMCGWVDLKDGRRLFGFKLKGDKWSVWIKG